MEILTIDDIRKQLYQSKRTANLIEVSTRLDTGQRTIVHFGTAAPVSCLLNHASTQDDAGICLERGIFRVMSPSTDTNHRYYTIETYMSNRKLQQFLYALRRDGVTLEQLERLLDRHCKDAYWLVKEITNESYLTPWEKVEDGVWSCQTPLHKCLLNVSQRDEDMYKLKIIGNTARWPDVHSYTILSSETLPQVQNQALRIVFDYYARQQHRIERVKSALLDNINFARD